MSDGFGCRSFFMARTKLLTFTCECCGKEIQSLYRRRFCSEECRLKQNNWVKNPRVYLCHWCGKHTSPRNHFYCSRECGFKGRAYERAYNARVLKFFREQEQRAKEDLSVLKKLIRTLEKIQKVKQREIDLVSECAECGCIFQAEGRRTKYCSRQCSKRAARKTPAAKKNKRIRRLMYRTRLKAGKRERIDPFEIFDRDNWSCQLCGCETPKELRGTIDARAPELDHIIPVSKGGDHTRANLQCLCRACNENKSDSLLFSFVKPPRRGPRKVDARWTPRPSSNFYTGS